MHSKAKTEIPGKWFFFILVFIFFEYGRPQDYLPIGFLRPGMILQLILIAYLFGGGKYKLANCKQTKQILAFIILTALFIPFAVNTHWAYETTKAMLMYMPFIASIMVAVDSIERLKKLIAMMVGMMVFICVWALMHDGRGIGNFAGDENDLSLYIITILPFCFYTMQMEKRKLRKGLYCLAMVIGILTIVASRSRGGFVGLVCMIAVAWWYSPKKVGGLLVLSMLAIGALYFGGEAYRQEMATVTDTQEDTARSRFLHWKTALNMFLDNPLGVGGNNYPIRQSEYQAEGLPRVLWGRAAHSLWFTLLPELGIAGIIIYFSLIKSNLKDLFWLRRKMDPDDEDQKYIYFLSLSYLASLAGFFSSGTFLSVLYYPHFWYYTGFIVATVNIGKKLINKTEISTT